MDLLFCNEHEARAYTGAKTREGALHALGLDCPMVFMTCGADGSMVCDHGSVQSLAGHRVPVVDTTGAGDSYAAGVLYGLTHGMPSEQAGKLGSFLSAMVVTRLGPRLKESQADRIPAILEGAHPLD